jgi:membrane carboxypeptidase/penicillin-binding protein
VQTAYQMVSMLSDVVDRGTGQVVRRAGLGFPVAGKTGTTDDF